MKSPAFSFYVRDWLCSNTVSKLHSKAYSKETSNLCSRGIGAYLFLLLQSWLQEPQGTLPNDDTELADFARVTPEEWLALKPLIMPVFKVGTDGRLFNERLMIEVRKQQVRSKVGSKGAANRLANTLATLEDEIEIEFMSFWMEYPRKVGKIDALKAWRKIDDVKSLVPKIMSTLAAQKKSEQWMKDGGQFIPHPSTWLNQGRWDDEVQVAGQLVKSSSEKDLWPINKNFNLTKSPERRHFDSDQNFESQNSLYNDWKRKRLAEKEKEK